MTPHRYLIVVEGELRAVDREWLADLEIGAMHDALTGLSGTLDQSGLHGVLRRLQYLALDLVAVHRLSEGARPRIAATAAATVS